MRVSKPLALVASLLLAAPLSAADVGWVSLNVDGTINPNDGWFTDILEGAGHTVTRYELTAGGTLDAARLDNFNSEDLLILSRANNSGNFDPDTTIWNEDVNTPILSLTPFVTRNNRMGWQVGNGLADLQVPSPVVADDPNHPFFTGIEFAEDGVTTAEPYNVVIARGISSINDTLVDGATLIATSPELDMGIAAAELPAGLTIPTDMGDNTLAGPRYFYAAGSRELGGVPISSSTLDLTTTGRRMYFNMVNYALGATVPEPGDFNADGTVDTTDFETLSDNLYGHLDGIVGFPHGDIDLDRDVDVADFGMFREMFPAVVAQAQGIPEPSTVALLAVFAVCALPWLGKRIRSRALNVGAIAATCFALAVSTNAQIPVTWEGGVGDYNDGSNWDTGFSPDGVTFNETAIIDNGGTAQLSDLPQFSNPVGLTLGGAPGLSGNLEILSGGELGIGANGDANIVIGQGSGSVFVANGGTLTTQDLLWNEAESSSLTLGNVGGSGDATLMLTGTSFANFHDQTTIVGPNVVFTTGGDILFGPTHTLTQVITGPTHSTVSAAGSVQLDGTLNVEFDGVTPGVGDSWDMFDAAYVIDLVDRVSSETALPDGYGLAVSTAEGGTNGMVASLVLEPRLTLRVDPVDGDAEIANLSDAEMYEIVAYGIVSDDSALTPANWSGFGGDWRESNAAGNHLGELNLTGARAIQPGETVSLGTPFDPAALSGTISSLLFEYQSVDGGSFDGVVVFGDVEGGGGGGPIAGDYDGDDFVGQGDIDLVLLNWGTDVSGGPPNGWTTNLPTGSVDQDELDQVLLNWGSSAALGSASAVPEPASCLLAGIAILLAGGMLRRR